MTKTTKLRAILVMLIAGVLLGGYLIVVQAGSGAKDAAAEAGFAAFH